MSGFKKWVQQALDAEDLVMRLGWKSLIELNVSVIPFLSAYFLLHIGVHGFFVGAFLCCWAKFVIWVLRGE